MFINGEHVGGCSETLKAHKEEKLMAMYHKDPQQHQYDYDIVVIGGGSGGLAASKVNKVQKSITQDSIDGNTSDYYLINVLSSKIKLIFNINVNFALQTNLFLFRKRPNSARRSPFATLLNQLPLGPAGVLVAPASTWDAFPRN